MSTTDPRLAGYQQWEGFDPFEEQSGPYFFKEEGVGRYRCAFITEGNHLNGQGALHGGALMTFADFAAFVFARPSLVQGVHAVTVSLNAEFTAAAGTGEFVEATGEIVHETGGMIFVRGIVCSGDRTLLNFSAVLKKLRPKP